MAVAHLGALTLHGYRIEQCQRHALSLFQRHHDAHCAGDIRIRWHDDAGAHDLGMIRWATHRKQRARLVDRVEHSACPRRGVVRLYGTHCAEDVGAQIVTRDLAGGGALDVGAAFHRHPAPSAPPRNRRRSNTKKQRQPILIAGYITCAIQGS